ncbi:ATP-dependent DNA helicase Q5 isoform X1 [Megachile rotundata]|uniref:ATP-dependent DNA helicase Q5 isoform X1 n=2 Tax=Megachile rotundata TaxID=143995 RepID=UPI003FD61C98
MKYDEASVIKTLQSVFGYDNFKNDVQKDAVTAIIKDPKYVCISMPPGFGRSLCFQLPIIIQKGKVAIIFSPKLSFMKKQTDFLKTKQINARVLHPSIYFNKQQNIVNDLTSTSPTIVLLYATPNMAGVAYFKKLILSLKDRKILSYIVFNEAHCLSTLGYEYTPDYKKIFELDKICASIPQIAVTTTVTDEVIKDICNLLALKTPKIFKLPVQQINVYYDIWFLDILSDPFEHLKNYIVEVLGFFESAVHKTKKGFIIVYCKEVITAELLKDKLNASGISTLTYHHRLKSKAQRNIENKWMSGNAYVITTTYNYGFIYKQSIRGTVYWTIPENIAKYYRESAQTYAHNEQKYCRIYFSVEEYSSIKTAIENHKLMNTGDHVKQRLSEYNKFVSYCLSVKCRHSNISKYFGHVIPPCKTNCDVCKTNEMVKVRTSKFITFSESIEGVKYVCDINEDLPNNEADINTEKQSKDISKTNYKKPKIICVETIKAKGNDERVDPCNNKLLDNKKKLFTENRSLIMRLSKKYCVQVNTSDTAKCTADNTDVIYASSCTSLPSVNENDSNKEVMPLEPSISRHNAIKSSAKKTNCVRTSNAKNVYVSKSSIGKVNEDERRNLIPRRDSNKAVIIDDEWHSKKSKKRLHVLDTRCENLKLKRGKLGSDDKAAIETEKMR